MGQEPPVDEVSMQESMALVAKYERLWRQYDLSVEELAVLLSRDEKAQQVVGIRTVLVEKGESAILGICYAPVWRPGRVKWQFPNPGQNGAKYSVKPEYANYLVWAQPPEQWIDGIYRAYWGACMAYKTPNGTTVTYYAPNDRDICYNWFICRYGGICPKWVNTCPGGDASEWPDNPLY